MSVTNMVCKYFKQRLVDIGGFGDGQKLICINGSCESRFSHIFCPNKLCGSNEKFVRVLGIGHELYKCKSVVHNGIV
jgi:hypothetical protein